MPRRQNLSFDGELKNIKQAALSVELLKNLVYHLKLVCGCPQLTGLKKEAVRCIET